jgi:copper ion binding protein
MPRAEKSLLVPDMSCQHCVKAIKAALGQLDGVEGVAVDLGSKRVRVTYDDATIAPDVMAKALEAAGYSVKAPAAPSGP